MSLYPYLQSEAEKASGNYDLICWKVDVESAWNRPDVLTVVQKELLWRLFIVGDTREIVARAVGLSNEYLNQVVIDGLYKLLADLTGYESNFEGVTDGTTVNDITRTD